MINKKLMDAVLAKGYKIDWDSVGHMSDGTEKTIYGEGCIYNEETGETASFSLTNRERSFNRVAKRLLKWNWNCVVPMTEEAYAAEMGEYGMDYDQPIKDIKFCHKCGYCFLDLKSLIPRDIKISNDLDSEGNCYNIMASIDVVSYDNGAPDNEYLSYYIACINGDMGEETSYYNLISFPKNLWDSLNVKLIF